MLVVDILCSLRNGNFIECDNNFSKYTINGEEVSEEIIDELFDKYHLAKYMDLKDKMVYSLNPEKCYSHIYNKWLRTTSYIKEVK